MVGVSESNCIGAVRIGDGELQIHSTDIVEGCRLDLELYLSAVNGIAGDIRGLKENGLLIGNFAMSLVIGHRKDLAVGSLKCAHGKCIEVRTELHLSSLASLDCPLKKTAARHLVAILEGKKETGNEEMGEILKKM